MHNFFNINTKYLLPIPTAHFLVYKKLMIAYKYIRQKSTQTK